MTTRKPFASPASERRGGAISWWPWLLATSLLSACSGAQVLNALEPLGDTTRSRDLPFGQHGLHLDVYTPAAAHAAPVVVFFYGGSWQTQATLDKSAYKFVAQSLAGQGFVVVVPDYRLYPQVRYPAFLDDCAEAVAWAHAHAAEYGGDPDKLVLMGHSAGAYNAAMLTLEPAILSRNGADRAWVRGMIGLAGPYDFLPLVDPALQEIFGPESGWPETQPIHYVDGRNPPLLLVAGDADDIVYVKNTVNLYNRVKAMGGPADRLIYPGMGHIRLVVNMASHVPGHADLIDHVAPFVRAVTGTPAP